MQQIYGDLHIHIGEALGKPVKITASRRLTLHSIIFEAAPAKGLDMVGVVDAGSTLVSAEIETMLENRELQVLNTGGMMASNGILLIPSVEAESREGVHLIIFLPSLQSIHKYQQYTSKKVSNRQLSTQKVNLGVADFIDLSLLLEGIFCPAHAFTPPQRIYGMWTDRLQAKLGRDLEQIKVLELGLSADSAMADMLSETAVLPFCPIQTLIPGPMWEGNIICFA
jgi:PHP family Zn ribbon phosphoesterase